METPPDLATIQSLRSDLALQIARHIRRSDLRQMAAARALGLPQPTVSKIMNGRVTELSLELLIRVAVRAGLPVVLQTGKHPAEAGAFVSSAALSGRASKSSVGEASRAALTEAARQLTPEERLEAHLKHSELVTALHHAGRAHRAGKSTRPGRPPR